MVEYIHVSDIVPDMSEVNMLFKVIEKKEVKKINLQGEEQNMCEILVGDETGIVLMVLWNDNISLVEQNGIYKISNGYTSLYKYKIQLNLSSSGKIERHMNNVSDIKVDNNMSTKQYRESKEVRYTGRNTEYERIRDSDYPPPYK